MDFKQIQELIKLVNESNIGEVSIEQKDFKIIVKQKQQEQGFQMMAAPMHQIPYQQQMPFQAPTASDPAIQLPQATGTPAAAANTITIKSPMIGTFYRRPSPDKPNFLEIGDEVSPGKVVCIIEAMKLFNEIESEVKGRIVKILVDDASPVEYDQPLFVVEPS